MKLVKIIFAPFEFGTDISGTSKSFQLILKKYPTLTNNALFVDFSDLHETKTINNMKNFDSVHKMIKRLSLKIKEVQSEGYIPLVIGGDHSISLASVSESIRNDVNVGLLWIDAHGDMNTNITSETGNIHGMVISSLLGLGDKKLIDSLKLQHFLRLKNVHIIGVRDLDEKEKELINKIDLKYILYEDLKEKGINQYLSYLSYYYKFKTNKIHLSIDLDSLNPIDIPGVSVPVKSGFTKKELISIVEYILNNFNVVSIDIVEYNPLKDNEFKTLKFLVELITLIKTTYN